MKKPTFIEFYTGLTGPDVCPPSEDFCVTDATDLSHNGKLEAIGSWLGFCGCGCPDAAHEFIAAVLDCVATPWDEGRPDRELALFGSSEGLREFVYYFLDDKGLTEHGSSIPGWLTPDGKLMQVEIRRLLALQPKDEA